MLRLSRAQVREVDRLSIERYHIPGIVLMENAARGAAAIARAMFRRHGLKSGLVLAGGGNNGGDGLAVARHLHNAGHEVRIALCTDPARYAGDALINWQIVDTMGLAATPAAFDEIAATRDALIIDAVFGTGLTQAPREPFPKIVGAVEKSGAPVLAIDLPSGLDCDSGLPLSSSCIRAEQTVTFVAQKRGFANHASRQFTGRISVAEIGCPKELVEAVARADGG